MNTGYICNLCPLSVKWRQFGLTAGYIYKVFLTYDYRLLNYQFIKKEVGVQYKYTTSYIF